MDSIDIAQELNSKFLEASLNKAITSRNITVAQERDEKGRVICKSCGSLIPKKRLKIIPTAVYCVECQEELERR